MLHPLRALLVVTGLFTALMLSGSPLRADPGRPEMGRAERDLPVAVGMRPAKYRLLGPAKYRLLGPASAASGGRVASSPSVLLQIEGQVGEQAEVRFRVQAKRKRLLVFEFRF